MDQIVLNWVITGLGGIVLALGGSWVRHVTTVLDELAKRVTEIEKQLAGVDVKLGLLLAGAKIDLPKEWPEDR